MRIFDGKTIQVGPIKFIPAQVEISGRCVTAPPNRTSLALKLLMENVGSNVTMTQIDNATRTPRAKGIEGFDYRASAAVNALRRWLVNEGVSEITIKTIKASRRSEAKKETSYRLVVAAPT